MSNPEQASIVTTMTMAHHQLKVMVEPELTTKIEASILRSQTFLKRLQHEKGYWIGELLVDTTVACDLMLFMYWMDEIDFVKQAKIVKHVLDRQQTDGGWNIYTGGPSEINASVKCYLTLKLAGFSPEDPVMKKAHAVILRLGGIPKMNTYGKLYLALLGQFPWKYLPIIPSEVILLPTWLYFNLYELSSWTRAMYVPLSIINHYKPTKLLPPEKQLHELYPYGTENQDFSLPRDRKWFTWRNFFLSWDAVLKFVDGLPWRPFRKRALKQSEAWMIERCSQGSDGLGAIFPSMLNSLIALRCLGYSNDHPIVKKCRRVFAELEVDDVINKDFRVQPCLSPIWDTAITCVSLATSGVPANDPGLVKAADWLIQNEVKIKGDWVVKNPYPHASGWAFEFANDYYPDVDDTFKVLLALRLIDSSDEKKKSEVMLRALNWAKSFQCKNGGYAAFDRDVTKHWLDHVPFADHKAILDPPCSDITARALECFGKLGIPRTDPVLAKAIAYLRKTQEEDGSWYGRWGVNYIYGTWQSLRGLHTIGEDMNQDWIVRARDWLESCQNPDGGWGETCASYDDPRLKGQGASTPSQTAWGLMGMLTCGDPTRASIQRAGNYLATVQEEEGSWREDYITGTGFPCVFYLKYDMYRNNWPLLALSELKHLIQKRAALSAVT